MFKKKKKGNKGKEKDTLPPLSAPPPPLTSSRGTGSPNSSGKPLKSILKTQDKSHNSNKKGKDDKKVSSLSSRGRNVDENGMEGRTSSPSASASASASTSSASDDRNSWKVHRLKLAAVRAFQEQVENDKRQGGKKYCKEKVTSLLVEMQGDLQRILTHKINAMDLPSAEGEGNHMSVDTRFAHSLHESQEVELASCFDVHEKQLMGALGDTANYLDMKKKWMSDSSKNSPAKGSRFKAAVNAVMFVGATKRTVRFTTRSVRTFQRSSSFWDHEYWDEQEEDSLSHTSSKSINSSAASILKESWINEWESRVSLMPPEVELQKACLKLVVIWVETGHFPNKSQKWERKFGKLSTADLIYHRVHRYPAVALRKLADLCHRPPNFFLDSQDRQEVALVCLYDALALWESGEVSNIHEVILECREEIEEANNVSKKDEVGKEKGEKKASRWNAFIGKVESGMKRLFSKSFSK